jgi:hypothetical protein
LIGLSAPSERKKISKHKVKILGPTIINENELIVSLAPVLEIWGKLDVLQLDEEDEYEIWEKRYFGRDEADKPK